MITLFSTLEKTSYAAEVIAMAMASVVSYLEGHPDDSTRRDRCRFAVGTIEDGQTALFDSLYASLHEIWQDWNQIVRSDVWKHAILDFFKRCRKFYSSVGNFDDSIVMNGDEASKIFSDCWIGRSYFMRIQRWMDSAAYAMRLAEEDFVEPDSDLGAFAGMAKRFRPFFAGGSDEDLRDFVVNGIAIPSRPRWRGSRCEGTLMGMELGLECADMNQSFRFLNDAGKPRPLKYSSDIVSMDRKYYKISGVLDILKKAVEEAKISHKSAI